MRFFSLLLALHLIHHLSAIRHRRIFTLLHRRQPLREIFRLEKPRGNRHAYSTLLIGHISPPIHHPDSRQSSPNFSGSVIFRFFHHTQIKTLSLFSLRRLRDQSPFAIHESPLLSHPYRSHSSEHRAHLLIPILRHSRSPLIRIKPLPPQLHRHSPDSHLRYRLTHLCLLPIFDLNLHQRTRTRCLQHRHRLLRPHLGNLLPLCHRIPFILDPPHQRGRPRIRSIPRTHHIELLFLKQPHMGQITYRSQGRTRNCRSTRRHPNLYQHPRDGSLHRKRRLR